MNVSLLPGRGTIYKHICVHVCIDRRAAAAIVKHTGYVEFSVRTAFFSSSIARPVASIHWLGTHHPVDHSFPKVASSQDKGPHDNTHNLFRWAVKQARIVDASYPPHKRYKTTLLLSDAINKNKSDITRVFSRHHDRRRLDLDACMDHDITSSIASWSVDISRS